MQRRIRLTALAAILLIGVSGCAAAPAATSSTTVTAEPRSAPVASASGDLESQTPSAAPATLTVEGFASVVVDGLHMRQQPGLGADLMPLICYDSPSPCPPLQVGSDTGYSELYLLDGPVQADGLPWYLAATVSPNVLTTEYIGWVAAGDETGPWLIPHEPACPEQPIELGDLTYSSLPRFEAIACFGGQELTVEGWYVELPADAEPPGECSAEPAWLVCGWGYHMLRPQPSGWYGDANHLPMKVDPASNVQMPTRGNWVMVTGMFDHPSARDCGSSTQEDAAFRLMCRMEFVVTSARLAD